MKDWLGKGDVLFLTGVDELPECEPQDVSRLLEPLGLKVSITTRYALAEGEIKRLLFEKGVSYLWQLSKLREDVLPRTPDLPALLSVLRNMIRRIAPSEELIIVDRYLLREASQESFDNLITVLAPILDIVTRIAVVTSQKHDARLFGELRDFLKIRKCEVLLRTSESFHDRFWIADRARGLFVGTSLNGIGKRYALADYMDEADVRTIITALSTEGLLE